MRSVELEEQIDGGVELEEEEEGAVELEVEEEGGTSSEVELVVMFKETRFEIQVKESTTMRKVKKKFATHYKRSLEGLVLKHLGAKVGDDFTAGSYQGGTLVLEELGEESRQPGGAFADFEVRIGTFMGLFHK